MISVIQRITSASLTADGEPYSRCGAGLLVLLGVSRNDEEEDIDLLVKKISALRIFTDSSDKMNLSVNDIGGEVMVVPNFTLLASYKKGNRPDYMMSAPPEVAERMFELFCEKLSALVPGLARGKFRSDMKVSFTNDGPVTICMDSRVLKGERDI